MISKSEFLKQIKKELSKKYKKTKTEETPLKECMIVVGILWGFALLGTIGTKDLGLVTIAGFIILPLIYIFSKAGINYMDKKAHASKALIKSGICSNKNYETDCPKLLLNLFNQKEANDWFVEWTDKSISFKEQNSILRGIKISKRAYSGYNRGGIFLVLFAELFRNEKNDLRLTKGYSLFSGLLVETSLKHSYREPVVFAKRGFFNRRKGLKKVQLPYAETYFDVWSNDESAARNLCFQGIAQKLLRLKDQQGIKKVEAAVFENKLYIALYSRENLFDSIERQPTNIHKYELFYDRIKQIEDYCAQFRDL